MCVACEWGNCVRGRGYLVVLGEGYLELAERGPAKCVSSFSISMQLFMLAQDHVFRPTLFELSLAGDKFIPHLTTVPILGIPYQADFVGREAPYLCSFHNPKERVCSGSRSQTSPLCLSSVFWCYPASHNSEAKAPQRLRLPPRNWPPSMASGIK